MKNKDDVRRIDELTTPEDEMIQPLEPRVEAHDQPTDDDLEDEDAEEDEDDRAGDL
jgi:hypothetical protein